MSQHGGQEGPPHPNQAPVPSTDPSELGFRQGVGTLAGFQDDRTEAQGVDGGGGWGVRGGGLDLGPVPLPFPPPYLQQGQTVQCGMVKVS